MRIERTFKPTERYEFDFGMCSSKNGWAQLDTSQDASYFGTWANPNTLEIFSYMEGDITHKTADNADEFKAEILEIADWNTEVFGGKFAIDGMCNDLIIQGFISLGLGHLLH